MPAIKVPVAVPDGAKWCNTCKAVKPLHRFDKDRRNPDGRLHRCTPCRRRKAKERDQIARIIRQSVAEMEARQAAKAAEIAANYKPEPFEPHVGF